MSQISERIMIATTMDDIIMYRANLFGSISSSDLPAFTAGALMNCLMRSETGFLKFMEDMNDALGTSMMNASIPMKDAITLTLMTISRDQCPSHAMMRIPSMDMSVCPVETIAFIRNCLIDWK